MAYACPNRKPKQGRSAAKSPKAPGKKPPTAKRKPTAEETETVQRLLVKIKQLPDVREELVARVRGQIDAGTYETPERLDQAVERMMEEVFSDEADEPGEMFRIV